jgi:hypothetical protein
MDLSISPGRPTPAGFSCVHVINPVSRRGERERELSGLVFLRHAIAEQHVTGDYNLTVDTLFGDDGAAAADDK